MEINLTIKAVIFFNLIFICTNKLISGEIVQLGKMGESWKVERCFEALQQLRFF